MNLLRFVIRLSAGVFTRNRRWNSVPADCPADSVCHVIQDVREWRHHDTSLHFNLQQHLGTHQARYWWRYFTILAFELKKKLLQCMAFFLKTGEMADIFWKWGDWEVDVGLHLQASYRRNLFNEVSCKDKLEKYHMQFGFNSPFVAGLYI